MRVWRKTTYKLSLGSLDLVLRRLELFKLALADVAALFGLLALPDIISACLLCPFIVSQPVPNSETRPVGALRNGLITYEKPLEEAVVPSGRTSGTYERAMTCMVSLATLPISKDPTLLDLFLAIAVYSPYRSGFT